MKPRARAPRLLFFSRGRGYGHALPDLTIADEILRLAPGARISFASYAAGAGVLRRAGRRVIEMRLPEANPFMETLAAAYRVLQAEAPALVVSHEEFAAVAAAKLLGIRSVYLGAWLPLDDTVYAEALGLADSIVMLGEPGVFPVPKTVRRKPVYAGPIVRALRFTRQDRPELRSTLGWEDDAFCVAVLPGGSNTEKDTPIADLVLRAFRRLPFARKRLCWISARDYPVMAQRLSGLKKATALRFVDPVERVLAAADVVITKGTRGATADAAAVGVPSISISHGRNPIDDILVPRMASNLALVAGAFDAEELKDWMIAMAARIPSPGGGPGRPPRGAEAVARHIVSRLR